MLTKTLLRQVRRSLLKSNGEQEMTEVKWNPGQEEPHHSETQMCDWTEGFVGMIF